MSVTILVLSVLSSAIPQPELHAFLARRDYDSAVSYYRSRLLREKTDVQDMRELARVYDHWHKFDSSLAWWDRVLEQHPDDDSAIVGRWNALYRRDEKDTTRFAATRLLIRDEASKYLYETTARYLTLLYDGMVLADSAIAERSAWLLAERFPESRRAWEVTGNLFYDSLYPVWTNDTLKIPIIRRFLAKLPRTEWRQTFYMFLLSSRFGLKDTAGLRADAAEMVADDTLDPFRYRYAAALFNRLKFDPKTAEAYARRAIELGPTATKPPNKPQEQWDLEYSVLYGGAQVALAEALTAQDKLDEAKLVLSDAKLKFRWDTNSEWTPAPFYCLGGEIDVLQSDTGDALLSFGTAVNWGDSRNHWTARADSAVRRLKAWTDRQLSGWYEAEVEVGEGSPPVFTDVTDSFGLKDQHEGRVAWGDYNNDRYQDLLLNGCVLFRNNSGRGFTNVTGSAGLADAKGRGGLFADFNNDYMLDIYVADGEGGARFYRNDFGRFVNLSDRAGGPGNVYPTEGAGWADFDNDGWVDLYCANYENRKKHVYYPDQLFQNQLGHLVDVTRKAGIIPPYGTDLAGRGVNWGDFNNDGYQDCYVSNYRLCENFLWVNNHDSTFTNQAAQLGVAGGEVSGWYGHTIGSEWGDYDNDGDLDLFCANLAHPRYIEFSNRSMLYENSGRFFTPPSSLLPPLFVDRRASSGIRYEETHSDPAWADVDNDGDLDLYITSIYKGRRSFLYENVGKAAIPRETHSADSTGLSGMQKDSSTSLRSTRNDEAAEAPSSSRQSPVAGRQFNDVTWVSGTRVFNGWGCAFADFDNDGDQDLVVGSGSGVRLFRNDTQNGNHSLEVSVIGRKANRAGIGARVTVTQGNSRQIREVEGGKGTMSQNSLVQHFGFGQFDTPVTVEVRFGPDSRVVLKNVKLDRMITVKENP